MNNLENKEKSDKNSINAELPLEYPHDWREILRMKKEEDDKFERELREKNDRDLNTALQHSYDQLKIRIQRILKLAINEKCNAIVLGAFGCGVFENDPDIVAEIFREVLIDEEIGYYFDHVVFAITGSSYNENYQSFISAFKAYMK